MVNWHTTIELLLVKLELTCAALFLALFWSLLCVAQCVSVRPSVRPSICLPTVWPLRTLVAAATARVRWKDRYSLCVRCMCLSHVLPFSVLSICTIVCWPDTVATTHTYNTTR